MIALWHALVQAVTGLELVLELVLVPAAHKPRPHQSTTPLELVLVPAAHKPRPHQSTTPLELELVPAAHKPRPHQSTTPHQLCMRSVSMAVVCRANRQAMQQAASTSVPSQLGVLSAASAFNQCGAHRRL